MTQFDKPIYVTMPTLAPLAEVDAYMEKIGFKQTQLLMRYPGVDINPAES